MEMFRIWSSNRKCSEIQDHVKRFVKIVFIIAVWSPSQCFFEIVQEIAERGGTSSSCFEESKLLLLSGVSSVGAFKL